MTPKQKKIAFAVVGGIAVLCIIASCSRRSYDYAYAPQPQVVAAAPTYAPAVAPAVVAAPPVIVQAAPAHDGFFTGMLMGHLMSGGGGTRVEHHYANTPTPAPVTSNVTKNVTINKTIVQAPPAPAAVAKPTYSAPSTVYRSPVASVPTYSRPATTSYSGSYSARSSYSSPSYSSRSFSSGRR